MHVSKLLFALTIAASASLALAQTTTDHKEHSSDPRGERPSPEKMQQMFDERFKKADTDGDGALSKAEAEKGMPMLARDFDKIDANKDGKVSKDEIRAAMEKRHAEMKDRKGGHDDMKGGMKDGMKGGEGGGKEYGQRKPMTAEERAKYGAEMFKKMDANGDGFVSEEEAGKGAPTLARRFKEIDANKDGKLSQDELHAWGEARHKEWEAKRGEKRGDKTGDKSGHPHGETAPAPK